MKEHPILFSSPMVRALLDGRKTQTRRVLNPQPEESENGFRWHTRQKEVRRGGGGLGVYGGSRAYRLMELTRFCARMCPYGMPGDRLWVRETWSSHRTKTAEEDARTNEVWDKFAAGGYPDIVLAHHDLPTATGPLKYLYAADFDATSVRELGPWRPSIFMPRAACRIVLEITDVRVQRLQDICEEDAAAEGVESIDSRASEDRDGTDFDHALCGNCGGLRLYTAFSGNGGAMPDTDCRECDTHAQRFRWLWDSINAKRAPWDSNPWVWAITFRRVEA